MRPILVNYASRDLYLSLSRQSSYLNGKNALNALCYKIEEFHIYT